MALLFRDTMLAMNDDAQAILERTKELQRRQQDSAKSRDCTAAAQTLAALTYQFVSADMFASGDLELMARALISLHLHSGLDTEVWPLVVDLAHYDHQAIVDQQGPVEQWRAKAVDTTRFDARPPYLLPASLWGALFECMRVPVTRMNQLDDAVTFSEPRSVTTVPMYVFVPFYRRVKEMGVRAEAIVPLFFVRHMLAPQKNYADVLMQPLYANLTAIQREAVQAFLRLETVDTQSRLRLDDLAARMALRDDLAVLLRHMHFQFPGRIALTPDLPADYEPAEQQQQQPDDNATTTTTTTEPQQSTDVSSDDAAPPTTQSTNTERDSGGLTLLVGAPRVEDRVSLTRSARTTTTNSSSSTPVVREPVHRQLRTHLTLAQRQHLSRNAALRSFSAQHAMNMTADTAPVAARLLVGNVLVQGANVPVDTVRAALVEHYAVLPPRSQSALQTRSILHSRESDAADWHALLASAFVAQDARHIDTERLPELAPVLALNDALPLNERATSSSQRLRRYVTAMAAPNWESTWRAAWPLSNEAKRAVEEFRRGSVPAATAQALLHAVAH